MSKCTSGASSIAWSRVGCPFTDTNCATHVTTTESEGIFLCERIASLGDASGENREQSTTRGIGRALGRNEALPKNSRIMSLFWAAIRVANRLRKYHARLPQPMFFLVKTHARAPAIRAMIGSV